MRRIIAFVAFLSFAVPFAPRAIAQADVPAPLAQLQAVLASAGENAPGRAAYEVKDLATGYTSGYNMNEVMPAASTIKIPIMVEVFRQMSLGNFDLNRRVELLSSDRDWGSGDIASSPVGEEFAVSTLLAQMITVSDNTAANMLIRLVGRRSINLTMGRLGLHHTDLSDYIRTAEYNVRATLRTSPSDMVRLLSDMARSQLIDQWSSRQMIAILEHQEINTLLPEPLPQIPIAHKTGSLDDTLNDVGIVYATQPYVIAVLTTKLDSLPAGRQFIRRISRVAFTQFEQLAKLRATDDFAKASSAGASNTANADDAAATTVDQDVPMWGSSPEPAATP